jgi:hypothetical protein
MHLFFAPSITSWLAPAMFPPKGGEKLLHLSCRVINTTIVITKNLVKGIKILCGGLVSADYVDATAARN